MLKRALDNPAVHFRPPCRSTLWVYTSRTSGVGKLPGYSGSRPLLTYCQTLACNLLLALLIRYGQNDSGRPTGYCEQIEAAATPARPGPESGCRNTIASQYPFVHPS